MLVRDLCAGARNPGILNPEQNFYLLFFLVTAVSIFLNAGKRRKRPFLGEDYSPPRREQMAAPQNTFFGCGGDAADHHHADESWPSEHDFYVSVM